ncbi:ComEC/Rec2 family competence protein [Paenibacillus endoradicis]|uniref:ComEC/Rec2 family competence protein n=1 Tax=Paenibacillus endoradicis TaxID=2972487 RepID=UPI00215986FC|nr:ComEC/Rec2 family competence protein [Paenibacillus endoradicis]MCR8659168.1 ComEC family competence protein [Paenibacillus endoradicis]
MINKRPIIAITICWLLGNIIISSSNSNISILWIISLLVIAIIIVLLRRCTVILALILVGCLLAGAGQRYMVDLHNKTALVEEWDNSMIETFETKVIGIITSTVEIDGDRVSFDLETSQIFRSNGIIANNIKEKFKVYVTLQTEDELEVAKHWKRGLNIQLSGELSRPAVKNNDGGFDYRQYLKYSRIHWLLKSKGSQSLQQLPDAESFSINRFKSMIDELRVKISAPLDQLFSKDQSGYIKGLILGIREELDPEQFRQFSTLGLTHILAISGLHVAVFMYIVTAILRIFRCSKERIIYVLLILIPLYVAITGGSPSVLRAGLMAMLGLIAARMNILKDGLHLIAIVALALVIINPYMIHNISFQLSFIVTIGLILGVPALSKVLPRTKQIKWLMDTLSVTLVAQFVSFPLTIYYFNQFHLLSFVANLILVPFISFIVMPLASFVMLISHVQLSIAKPFVQLVQWCNDASFKIVALLSKVHPLHFIWATPPIWWIVGWYALLLAFFALLQTQYAKHSEMIDDTSENNKETVPLHGIEELNILFPSRKVSYFRKHGKLLILTLLAVGCLIYAYEPLMFARFAYVSFLDVGQGLYVYL